MLTFVSSEIWFAYNIYSMYLQASNPGQFDQDVDVTWQKGHTSDTVYHAVSHYIHQ